MWYAQCYNIMDIPPKIDLPNVTLKTLGIYLGPLQIVYVTLNTIYNVVHYIL